MLRSKKTKTSFKRDEKGRVVLGSAKEMAEWVNLGYKEQDTRNTPDIPFKHHYIDLSNYVLYSKHSIASLSR